VSKPIFIGGVFRSGTTLIRAMLTQHSALAGGLETYWFECEPRGRNSADFEQRMDRLARFFELDRAAVSALAARAQSAAQFLDLFMAEVARCQGKSRWVEKTPGNVARLDDILAYWPDAFVLHMVRDPKDVFASLHGGGKSGGPAGFAQTWCDIAGKARRDAARLGIAGRRYLEVRYEQLVLDPEPTMRAVLAFVEAAWEAQVARFAGKDDEFDKVREVTGKSSTTLERLRLPLNHDKIGSWTGIVAPAELDQVRREVAARGFAELFAQDEAVSEQIALQPRA
jgi:hypothetical protein